MNHVVLIGDSIFDNGPYVDQGDSVSEILKEHLASDDEVTLLAVDGDVTTDVPGQLSKFPAAATNAFVSCGGNDALRVANILNKKSSSVGESLEMLNDVIEEFRANYINMLLQILQKTSSLSVCTIYNKIPGLGKSTETALALFNEAILEESAAFRLPVIDLRIICNEEQDYSSVSPIEPSKYGAQKIVQRIVEITRSHEHDAKYSTIYK